jgi:hypothetical protein
MLTTSGPSGCHNTLEMGPTHLDRRERGGLGVIPSGVVDPQRAVPDRHLAQRPGGVICTENKATKVVSYRLRSFKF